MDATGVATTTRALWFSIRVRKRIKRKEFLKLDGFADLENRMFASALVVEGSANDSPLFIPLLEKRPEEMEMGNVGSDAGNMSRKNAQYVANQDGTPYISLKSNVPPNSRPRMCPAWSRMVECFHFDKPKWKRHRNPRSIIEAMWRSLKRRFGEAVTSRKRWRQKKEALLKVACYNALWLGYARAE